MLQRLQGQVPVVICQVGNHPRYAIKHLAHVPAHVAEEQSLVLINPCLQECLSVGWNWPMQTVFVRLSIARQCVTLTDRRWRDQGGGEEEEEEEEEEEASNSCSCPRGVFSAGLPSQRAVLLDNRLRLVSHDMHAQFMVLQRFCPCYACERDLFPCLINRGGHNLFCCSWVGGKGGGGGGHELA